MASAAILQGGNGGTGCNTLAGSDRGRARRASAEQHMDNYPQTQWLRAYRHQVDFQTADKKGWTREALEGETMRERFHISVRHRL